METPETIRTRIVKRFMAICTVRHGRRGLSQELIKQKHFSHVF